MERLELYLGSWHIVLDPGRDGQGLASPVAGWLFFSEAEREILTALLDGPLTRNGIAAALQRSADGQLKELLANLGARGVLVTTPDGYRINLPAGRTDEFRAWLDTQQGSQR
jgi:hypothetical protein